MTTNLSGSPLSRRTVLASLAAAAVVSGCKPTHEALPSTALAGTKNTPRAVDDPGTKSSKAALALWLLFTTRPGFVAISVGPSKTKVTLNGKLLDTLQQDLSGLPGNPAATINALIAYLESADGHSRRYGSVDSAGKVIPVSYAVALQAVQELFQNFGTGNIPNMDPSMAPYTGSCCPRAISNILTLATPIPSTQDSDYSQCP